jgi:hypothetical protein
MMEGRNFMPQSCTVCRSEKRPQIDEALLRNEPFRSIAARFGKSATALVRHKASHLTAALVAAKQAHDTEYAGTVFERLRGINGETIAILREARAASNPALALMAVGRIEKQLELEAKLLGQLNDPPARGPVLVVVMPGGASMPRYADLEGSAEAVE